MGQCPFQSKGRRLIGIFSTLAQSSPKRCRYLRSRSASLDEDRRDREALNRVRPASDSERLRGRRARPRRAGPGRTGRSRRAPRPRGEPRARQAPMFPTRPEALQPGLLALDRATSIRPPGRRSPSGSRSRRGRGNCRPRRASGDVAKARKRAPRLLVEADPVAFALGEAVELVIEVGLDILAPVASAGQLEGPQVEAREQIVAERARRRPPRRDRGWCRRSAGSRTRPPCRRRPEGSSSPRSRAGSSPARRGRARRSRRGTACPCRRCAAGPGRSAAAPVKAPFLWPNKRRHRAVALQRRAVHLDEVAARPGA